VSILVKDKGAFLKILQTGSEDSDIQNVYYYLKTEASQQVISDEWQLIINGEVKVSVGSPNEFKDFEGGAYESWDEVTNFIQDVIHIMPASNSIETDVSLVLNKSNIVASSVNVVYVITTTNSVALTLNASLTIGTIINVKDISGNANVKNITVSGVGQTIDAAASLVINGKWESFTIVKKSASEWFIISGLI